MAAKGGLLSQWGHAFLQWVSLNDFWGLNALLFFSSWLLMFLVGGPLIGWLRQKRWKKDVVSDVEAWQVREDTPETHQKKQGTPSMGGIGIIGVACGVFISCVGTIIGLSFALNGFGGRSVVLIFAALFLMPFIVATHAGLGFADDWSKASGRGGLRARAKIFGQLGLGTLFLAILITIFNSNSFNFPREDRATSFLTKTGETPTFIIVCAVLLVVIIGTSNAVNLTDGIDGLAAGLAVQFGLASVALMPIAGSFSMAAVWFWAALAGSCLGFLAFNKYPAKVFMGDTGSLALGAAVGAAAIITRSVFLLPFIAFIYFVEMFSVTLQVAYFKYTKRKYGEGRRIFRRAPLHHHFELGGWSEWRVVGTFWAINLVTSVIGLILWHKGILPRFP